MPHKRQYIPTLLAILSLSTTACAEDVASINKSSELTLIHSLDELKSYASKDKVKVRLAPGTYTLDTADSHKFIRFTGNDSHYDLSGVVIRVDNELFRSFGVPKGLDNFYCVIDLIGDRIAFEGATIETFGDFPGIQSKNKIINITGSGVVARNLEITTSGSSPWGYGSLFGIASGDVRKKNGIRVGWPAVGSKVIGCKVHMRAMGHAIFVQGAQDTLIEDCHIDGLLKPTNDILTETSGYAYDRNFKTAGHDYIEGVHVGAKGEILPDEIISLSEDGIRLYGKYNGVPTGSTTIRNCSVTQMRRGICTGLNGDVADLVENCEVTNCVAAGFNVSEGDQLINCRADAKYAEALSCPYSDSRNLKVDLEILDSRNGLSNDVLATINGSQHHIKLHTADPAFVPESMCIALGTRRGYAFYQMNVPPAKDIQLKNETMAHVVDDSEIKE